MPCVVAAAAMRHEFGGWKWFGVAFLYQTGLAWGMALLVHQVGRALGWGA
jgi:ferrous iron transport protein B